ANLYFSEVAAVEPAQGRGGQIAITQGPLSATVSLTDGYYTGVVNYLQWNLTYTPTAAHSFSFFGGANLGRTGANVHGVGDVLLNNSRLVGLFYTYTADRFSLTPEVQYQYAARNNALGIGGPVTNLSLALFGDYQFTAGSPWSVGGFVEYATETYNKAAAYTAAPDFFGYGPGASITGISITPTWQGKNLFVRSDVGFVHVHPGAGGAAFGTGKQADQVSMLMEAGVLF
ncbi:MAG TPA: outer membrane beta-barrel protein, partial [Acidocella sp.]|nr:outer membrane beta-barrel protein [Acidocella sp.]